MSTTIKHRSLGEVTGRTVDGAAQFLGLKYASLRDRLSPPELVEGYSAKATDATNYGPPPVSPIGAIQNEFSFIQHSLPVPEVPAHSDIEGLNLNITVPLGKDGKINPAANLPVYVFIHGGGFAFGSGWYPTYDPAAIVRLSAELGTPIIGVTINYRLGALGFLTSEELRNAGYKANNGYHDQRTAMRWVRKHINGFGGNSEEITVVGESAGGLSALMLLTSPEPLMKRCLCTGGALMLLKPLPPFVADTAYQSVIELLGLANKSPQERVTALLSMPVDELWQKIPPTVPLLPVLDDDIVTGTPTFQAISSRENDQSFFLPGRKWCEALMMGDSKLDASILAPVALDARKANIAQHFIESANRTLSSNPDAVAQLLKSYDINTSSSDDDALLSILRFATDIQFYAAGRAMAQGWPSSPRSKFFLYHLNEGITWPGRFQGEAAHIYDVVLLFQNFNEFLSSEQKRLAVRYATDFIKFVSGQDPWSPCQDGNFSARVYGPTSDDIIGKFVEKGEPTDVGRSDKIFKLGDMIGLDAVLDVFANFFQGK